MSMNPSELDPGQLMNLVEQVEALPPKVLELVMHRRQESEKEAKKAAKTEKEELSQYMNISKAINPLSKPMAAPAQDRASQDAMLAQLLGTGMGNVDDSLLI